MIALAPPQKPFETDRAGELIYPVDNGEPLSNDTEHLKWITFLKNGLEDWFGDREDVFIAADLKSHVLDMTFGMNEDGRLWVRRPDGKLIETQRQLARRAEAEANRAEKEAKRDSLLAAKLRELGVDPDSL